MNILKNECCICFEYAKITYTDCGHFFCDECYYKLLDKNVCPLCRKIMSYKLDYVNKIFSNIFVKIFLNGIIFYKFPITRYFYIGTVLIKYLV